MLFFLKFKQMSKQHDEGEEQRVCVLLEEVSQVKQSSVMLRVDVQSFPVVALSLLWAPSQCAEIVHGAGVARV